MKELLEAGVHFGHQTHRWNPKMKDFIYGEHNNIHIIDLSQTMGMLKNALGAVREVTQSGGRILFVGTKRQASETISESASQCAQYYVNHRWLGGTLTNWKTISNTIARLKSIQETLDEEESAGLTKKELLKLTRERDKLELSIGGIKNMGSLPDLIFVIDTVREQIAIKEANKLNIPIAAIIDTNCDSGYVDDCSDDGDCCPESWIGDGYEDCADQAWGCDLSCLLYTSPSPRDGLLSRMPSSA